MLRAVSSIYVESQALELLSSARRDVFKRFRTSSLSTQAPATQTVLSATHAAGAGPAPPASAAPPAPPAPPYPPPPPPRRAWHVAATALAVSASLGGFFYYRKRSDDGAAPPADRAPPPAPAAAEEEEAAPIPAAAEQFPAHVEFLLVGAGTASFAAMRALRAARPEARVLLVGEERELPYMRPPLSKELWREPELAGELDALTFRQWNGRRRPVAYEPPAFYAPVEALRERGGAAVARGWRVARLDVARHEAELAAPGRAPVRLRYGRALLATGSRARRTPALAGAAERGRALTLRGVRDVWRVARELRRDDVTRVLVLGGGFLAAELSAALAERLAGSGRTVLQVFREDAPLAGVLPGYLAREAARRLQEAGVTLVPNAEVVGSAPAGGGGRGERVALADGGALAADLVLECVGAEAADDLARRSRLETHAALGGVVVNAELQARSDVWAAGDVACFYDEVLGRRRVEHHDHAVLSGRLAGENMAGVKPPQPYTHQSMFWSDLGPQLGYEAIGIIDSRLPTVGVFSADAVTSAGKALVASAEVAASGVEVAASSVEMATSGAEVAATGAEVATTGVAVAEAAEGAEARRFERGVVFYLRERRVVGVLLWNLFNRMHVARQVLAQGEFEDLFEVAKLFSLHEDE